MATAELLRVLVDATLACSAAVLVVLLLRRPLRHAFGARVAYAAWALVPMALAAALLPRPEGGLLLAQDLVEWRAVVRVAAGPVVPAASPWTPDWRPLAPAAWLVGAALAAGAVWRRQRRYVAGLGRLRRDADGIWRGRDVAGPAVVGALRPRIVLPDTFEARHGADAAALVVAHERAHLARGDTRANLVAAVLGCLQWFNPLLRHAAGRFRLDQELACDATVLARHPDARRRYAEAMLNVQLAVPGLPVGCHWQSSQSLKERLLMLKQPQPGAARRRGGLVVVGLALATCSYGAWALRLVDAPAMSVGAGDSHGAGTTPGAPPAPPAVAAPDTPAMPAMPAPPPAVRAPGAPTPPAMPTVRAPDAPTPPAAPTVRAPDVPAAPPAPAAPAAPAAPPAPPAPPAPAMPPPRYPAGAAAAGQGGRVVLKLLVATDGHVRDVVVEQSDPPGVFDANAVEAARQWVLAPALEDGVAVEAWVRVPVDFSPTPPGDPATQG